MGMKISQNLLLSRILTYMNGTLFNDSYFKIANFIVFHYLDMENMNKEDVIKMGPFKEEELDAFMSAFGFNDYEEFKLKLYNDYQTRLNQIRVRLIDVHPEQFLDKMDMTIEKEELQRMVCEICEKFYKAKRIIILGALYPLSLGVELQTDMITFGKPFIQYHSYNPIVLNKDDVIIIVSATGRALKNMQNKMQHLQVENAYSVLLTQNATYRKMENENTRVLVLPGRFDSVDFNYQLMAIFDLIRLQYFQQYLLPYYFQFVFLIYTLFLNIPLVT